MNARIETSPPAPTAPWSDWRAYFEGNAHRPLPPVDDLREALPARLHEPLLEALARFQVGECGEGRIAREIHRAELPGIDDDYRAALGSFIREEGRHARILAAHIKTSGGELLKEAWTRQVFSVGRRVAGPRTELVALMAAEIVGISFYAAVAEKLPPCSLRNALRQIAQDERGHLAFHIGFFAAQIQADPAWRLPFNALWFGAVSAGATLMVLDNRVALAAMDIDPKSLWRWQLRRARRAANEVQHLAGASRLGHVGLEGVDRAAGRRRARFA